MDNILTTFRQSDKLFFEGIFWIVGDSIDDILKGNFSLIGKIANITGKQNQIYYGQAEPVSAKDGDVWFYEAPTVVIGAVIQTRSGGTDKVIKLRTNGALIPNGAYIPIAGVFRWTDYCSVI